MVNAITGETQSWILEVLRFMWIAVLAKCFRISLKVWKSLPCYRKVSLPIAKRHKFFEILVLSEAYTRTCYEEWLVAKTRRNHAPKTFRSFWILSRFQPFWHLMIDIQQSCVLRGCISLACLFWCCIFDRDCVLPLIPSTRVYSRHDRFSRFNRPLVFPCQSTRWLLGDKVLATSHGTHWDHLLMQPVISSRWPTLPPAHPSWTPDLRGLPWDSLGPSAHATSDQLPLAYSAAGPPQLDPRS
jgi:hypothetical protein